MNTETLIINGQTFNLLPQRAAFWVETSILLIADVHLGKGGHFRKAGIGLPAAKDLVVIENLIQVCKPKQVVFMGDLFHSDYNREWDDMKGLLERNHSVNFILIKGNHDVMHNSVYLNDGIEVRDEWVLNDILLTHEPVNHTYACNIYGHIHPAVRLKGTARQSIKIPCFYRAGTSFILPAFGKLTGLYAIRPERDAEVFGVAGNKVIRLSNTLSKV